MWCKYFFVPDDGQEWLENGECEMLSHEYNHPSIRCVSEPARRGFIVIDSMNNDVASTELLGVHVIVKQWYYCSMFIGDVLKYMLAMRKDNG